MTGAFSDTRWMSTCISRENLSNLISDANARGMGMSTDVSVYQVTSYSVQAEIAIIDNKLGWVASTIGDMWLVNRY
jgi:hypothetical protein